MAEPNPTQLERELRLLRANGVDITERWLKWAKVGYAAGLVDTATYERTVEHILVNDPAVEVCEWIIPLGAEGPR